MKTMLAGLILLSLAAAPAANAGTVTPAPERTRFQGLFVDWNSASRQAIETERLAAQRPTPPAQPQPGAGPTAGSVALGERVGDVVALGDCAEGERIARAAGDFALVAAVRAHCTADDPQR